MFNTPIHTHSISLGCINPIATTGVVDIPEANCKANVPCQARKKKMYDNDFCDNSTENERKQGFLTSQLTSIFWRKTSELETKFNINPPAGPTSPKEFVDRIKTGKFSFDKNYLNDDGTWRDTNNHRYFNSLVQFITWRDPDKPEDAEGFKAAMKEMDKALESASLKIAILPPTEGLAIVEAFEKMEF